ncbi:hypothetical protein ACFW2I_32170 [Streptomyces nigra]|uniref:effector-associated domain 2-containing protein n=1 Tax=Streptomyces nigra TaxID=1827580 RepID=UPI0036807AD1
MVEAVLASASFSSPASRELLLWVTGKTLGRSLLHRGNSSPVLQCVDLIRTCDSEPGGLRVLLEILTGFEPDSSGRSPCTSSICACSGPRTRRPCAPHTIWASASVSPVTSPGPGTSTR